MLKKYKKLCLGVAACMSLSVVSSEAAVTLTFSQSGNNVIAVWSGTYLLPPKTATLTGDGSPATALVGGTNAYGIAFAGADFSLGGNATVNLGDVTSGTYEGSSFGFANTLLFFPIDTLPGLYSPSGTMTFDNTTLAALGVQSFSNTLAFTGNDNVNGSQEIRFTAAAIPEPASVLLGSIGVLIMALRRRRSV